MKRFAPGPKGHPLFGCFADFRDRPLQLLAECRADYGPVVQLPVGFGASFCLAFDPVDLEKIFHGEHFGRSDIAGAFKPLAGGSMIIADGETWQAQRRAVIPSFALPRMRTLAPRVEAIAERTVASWAARSGKHGGIDLQSELVGYAMSVLTEFLFGSEIAPSAIQRIGHWWPLSLRYMNVRLSQPIPLPDWLPTPNNRRLHHAAGQIAQVLLEVIERHRATPDASNGGFLSDLIAYRDEGSGQPLPDARILQEIMGVFLAGFDTVASGMMWTLYDLARHRDWQGAVRHELAGALPGGARLDLRDFPLLDQVFSESLRLSPSLWLVDRKTNQETRLGDCLIPAGTNIITSPWVTHRDPALWPDPEHFNPLRFSAGADAQRPKYAYFPFGGGRMKCIGIGLAKMQLRALVSQTLARFELSEDPERPAEIEPAFVLRTRSGLHIKLRDRIAQHAPANPATA
ncbi:cytochrome P450 [Pseudomonas sp. NCHU5208]|uniref:cytochrome P450 n=1 Tax=unclassified Pseudomonas TaxID=196821 RepID=UPI003F9D7BC6